jgi:signal transduction histidine kinase
MMSLRVRVALSCAALMLVLQVLGAGLLSRQVAVRLQLWLDQSVVAHLMAAGDALAQSSGSHAFVPQDPEVVAYRLISVSGATVTGATVSGATVSGAHWMEPPTGLSATGDPILGFHGSPDGRHCRTAWMRLHLGDQLFDLGVALSVEQFRAQQNDLHSALLVTALAEALVVAVVLALAVGRMLTPHARLAAEVAALDPKHPEKRIRQAKLPAELQGIAMRINELCDRLERAYGLASSFHAASAHELRTPLAGLRATIEVAQQTHADAPAALAACHAIVLQMQSRLDNLLMAARIDSGKLLPRREEVDVHDLLRRAWALAEARATARALVINWRLEGEGIAIADPDALRMVLTNLIDNAVSHTTGSGAVEITAEDRDARLVLTIANPAPGLTQSSLELIFDRGWRASSGNRDPRHSGLGMGITRELVGLMGGRIAAHLNGGLYRIEIALPAPGVFEYW